ncbi:MAG: hypothetical protein ACLR0U_15375 [Enterocloster clostridioformis]
MKTLKQGLDRFLATVCIIDFIGMVLLTVYQVIMRYVFKKPQQCQRGACPLLLRVAHPSVRYLRIRSERPYLHHLFKR